MDSRGSCNKLMPSVLCSCPAKASWAYKCMQQPAWPRASRMNASLQHSFAIPHVNYTEHKSSRWIIDNSHIILCLLHLLREEPHAKSGLSFNGFFPRAKETLCHCYFMIFTTHMPAMQGIDDMTCKHEGLFWSDALLLIFVCRLTTFLMMSHFLCKDLRSDYWQTNAVLKIRCVFGLWLDHNEAEKILQTPTMTCRACLHRES